MPTPATTTCSAPGAERRTTPRFVSLQPRLPFTPLPLEELLQAVRREHFSELGGELRVAFFTDGPLACARGGGSIPVTVRLHDVLNTPLTPPAVFSALFTSALLGFAEHRDHDGLTPASTLARELELVPDREAVRARLFALFGLVLTHDPVTLLASAVVEDSWATVLFQRARI